MGSTMGPAMLDMSGIFSLCTARPKDPAMSTHINLNTDTAGLPEGEEGQVASKAKGEQASRAKGERSSRAKGERSSRAKGERSSRAKGERSSRAKVRGFGVHECFT